MPNSEAAIAAPPAYRFSDLERLMSLMTGDEKHSFAATSTLDVLWVLYGRVLPISRDTVNDPGRDRFMLSKGHGPMAFYAVLAAKGFVPVEWLETFGRYDSPLGYHPDRNLIPGVEIASGSLGHGLALACGAALALRAQRRHTPRIYCLLGDAEMDEGSVGEAIVLAGRERLASLVAIVIDNASSSRGWPGGIAARYELEGWDAVTIDGRDHDAIEAALRREHPGHPLAVVAQVEAKQ
jgi:transketolase